jgi:ectoine hydroxylase-related dioxygenase (phytanoyl-CoA dioxygenase family)
MQHSGVARIAKDARLVSLVQDILGSKAIPFRATLFDKSLVSNWLVAWHQDTALPLQYRREAVGWEPWSMKDDVIYAHAPSSALTQVLALRLHLDDLRSENGPLRVLPDSSARRAHRRGNVGTRRKNIAGRMHRENGWRTS